MALTSDLQFKNSLSSIVGLVAVNEMKLKFNERVEMGNSCFKASFCLKCRRRLALENFHISSLDFSFQQQIKKLYPIMSWCCNLICI